MIGDRRARWLLLSGEFIGAMEAAKKLGALVISLTCVENSEMASIADISIAPVTGPDSLQILDEATGQLSRLRTPYWLGDSAVRLHALTSLIAQAEQLLPQAVHDARDQELTWAQIGELLGTTAATAARRYRNKP